MRKIIENSEMWVFGLRKDDRRYAVGEEFLNSRDWCDDQQEAEEYGYPYDPDTHMWLTEELDGVSTIKIDPNSDDLDKEIADALKQMSIYGGEHLYLVGGMSGHRGNDRNEMVIKNGACLAVLE